jgi:BirA family biotin operon repressor/biotin-[acetyl-CoA-carboxylase] ligase
LDFGFTPIRNLWLEKAFNLNQEIAVNLPNQSLRGIFKNLDEHGNLVLEVNNQIQLIASGEIFS